MTMHITRQGLRHAVEIDRALDGHWSEELRQRICAYARARRARGATTLEVARELGFPSGSLSRWLRAPALRDDSALMEVRVAETVAVRCVAVVSPSGFRIEGLSLSEAASVLREIG